MITIVVEIDAVVLQEGADHVSARELARRVEAHLSHALNRETDAASTHRGGASLDQTAAMLAGAIVRALPAPES